MTKDVGDDDHVARYCTPMRIDEDGTPLPAAFELREADEYLSVNWLEYFGVSSVRDNMAHVRRVFSKHHSISANGQFAVLNVGNVRRLAREELGRSLHVKDLQEDDYPSHAGIDGYVADDDDVPIALSDMVGKGDMQPGMI